MSANNLDFRLDVQGKLQAHFIPLGLCYNFNFNEMCDSRDVESGKFTSEAGVYCIRNKLNNACYFGETGQSKGLSGRLGTWKRKLRQCNADRTLRPPNQKLQADWDLYGENNFEFLVIEFGVKWSEYFVRKERETELVNAHTDAGFIVYNYSDIERTAPFCRITDRDRILGNTSPYFKPYLERLKESPLRKAIVAEGNIYLSIEEASQYLGSTRRNIRGKIARGNYRYATQEEILQEKNRRLIPGNQAVLNPQNRRSKGIPRPVSINGQIYESASAAERTTGITVQNISQSINRGREGWFYIDEGQRPARKQQKGFKRRVVARGKLYESMSAAARDTKLTTSDIQNRINRNAEGFYFPDDTISPDKNIFPDQE
uniref:Putative site-specific DNA endonuclease n=1 Tax=Stigeoclonium helveticum TaxID=55999 RepID=Q06SD0_STIHE|nr:putative site-specific DNA endonuclease [Stigeoclonium helveticum]ABF60222.1 putative site-specific DNA endonuclease [Stigeoclonium helveticum]